MCLMTYFCTAQKTWNTRDSVARGVSISVSTGISHYLNTLQSDASRISLKQNLAVHLFVLCGNPNTD